MSQVQSKLAPVELDKDGPDDEQNKKQDGESNAEPLEKVQDKLTEENGSNPSSSTSVLLSNKGKNKVIFHGGHKFRFDKVYNGVEYYMCES